MKSISYDSPAIARMVSFCLISPRPRIQRETGESLPALRAIAAGKRQPSPAVRTFLSTVKKKGAYQWEL